MRYCYVWGPHHRSWASSRQRTWPNTISTTADIPTSRQLTISTFADNTAILSRSKCPRQATAQLALYLAHIEKWLSDWRIKVNKQKCKHVTFTLNKQDCPSLILNNTVIPKSHVVTYLGIHLDRRLTWRRHIKSKWTHLKLKANSLHWLLSIRLVYPKTRI